MRTKNTTKKGFKQVKSPTKKDIEAKMEALNKKIELEYVQTSSLAFFAEKGDDYKSICFADMGLRIQICKYFVIASTNCHQHIWNKVSPNGYSQTCTIIEMLVDIAKDHIDEISDKNDKGEVYYSMYKLRAIPSLTNSEKVIIQTVCDWWYPLNEFIHSLALNKLSLATNRLGYVSWLSRASSLLNNEEKKLTYNKFIDSYLKNEVGMLFSNGIIKENVDISTKKCNEIIEKALEDIRTTNAEYGAVFDDYTIKENDEKDEPEALKDLQH